MSVRFRPVPQLALLSMESQVLWLLIDGIGDLQISQLNNCTPLEYSHTPWMDLCAYTGLCGLMDPVEPGLACGSDTAHMSLLGYDPRKYYRGRGAFESIGAGMQMRPGDIAFKSNFAYIEKQMDRQPPIVCKRRADRQFHQWGPQLCKAIDGLTIDGFPQHRVYCKYATEHRCGVVISGPGLSDRISGTDPLRDGLPLVECRALHPEAEQTARIVNALHAQVHRLLIQHPLTEARRQLGLPIANCLLFRGCGQQLSDLPPFQWQREAFAIAPTCMIAGWFRTLGVDTFRLRSDGYSSQMDADCEANTERYAGVSGDFHSDLLVKADKAYELLLLTTDNNNNNNNNNNNSRKRYRFGFVHCKGMDDAGHDGHIGERVEFCERVDQMLGHLIKRLLTRSNSRDGDLIIVITGDHSTPVQCRDHSADPVPFLITCLSAVRKELTLRSGIVVSSDDSTVFNDDYLERCVATAPVETEFTDSVSRFGERYCANGRLGRFIGLDVIPLINSLLIHN